MKKIIYIIVLVGALTTVSCNNDMNFDAYNTLPQKNFWQTQADAESAIFACYGKLSDWPFIEPTTFGPQEVASDNTAKGSSTDDQPDVNRSKRFIRAWTYFELVRMFGEVVIYDGLPKDGAYNIAKSSVEDVYAFILKDLEYGYANMSQSPWAAQWKGRVTAWAARSL